MSLSLKLNERAAAGQPVRIGMIGAGKFGTMFLAQARLTPGMHLVALADLMPGRAAERLIGVGWSREQISAKSLGEAVTSGGTHLTDDALAMIAHPAIDVIVEATGDPATGIALCKSAIAHGKHIVMVNVEADALAGPLLNRLARAAGVVYSLAWGDQPALIAEHVDWARTCGFKVVAAGKGGRYLPSFHQSNPETIWDILDGYLTVKDRSHINPKMFNSFLDGTKSGIEMTAVCNATGLVPQTNGLGFPPSSRFDISNVARPKAEGGTLEKKGVTEVLSCLNRDGTEVPHNLMLGTYVVVESESEYGTTCFAEYNLLQDSSERYAALYRPLHYIGLELGISIASVALRGEPTGAPICFNSDVVATAKIPLKDREMLDGEGGFTVWGKQTPAEISLREGYLPLGLAHNVKLKRDIAVGEPIRWTDVEYDANSDAVKVRREMEAMFSSRSEA